MNPMCRYCNTMITSHKSLKAKQLGMKKGAFSAPFLRSGRDSNPRPHA